MGRLQDGELTPEEAEAKAQSLGIPRLNKAILIPKDTTRRGRGWPLQPSFAAITPLPGRRLLG